MSNSLKDAWSNFFKVGAAVNKGVVSNKEADAVLKRHFSTLTIENAMKFGVVHPAEDTWLWDECDLIADYARNNGMLLRGHTLVWHNQTSEWVFNDGNETVSKNKLYKRLEDHISVITSRYNDIIYSWDVVNEAIETEKGDENNFRLSKWYEIGGKEVYSLAFRLMREASPNAKLFYNDYNNEAGSKLEANIRFLSSLLDEGVPIDGIGLQGHWYYNFPDEKSLRNALERYSGLGLEIEFTEVDISLYQWDEAREPSLFFSSRPQERMIEQAKIYNNVFTIASDYPAVKNITTWGIADNDTWLDNFPVVGRKNWPLLFDEQYREKPVVSQLIEAGLMKKTKQ
jgi:endo-1,4-beta-xylanase